MGPVWLKARYHYFQNKIWSTEQFHRNRFQLSFKLASWVSLKISKPAEGGQFSKCWKSRLGSGGGGATEGPVPRAHQFKMCPPPSFCDCYNMPTIGVWAFVAAKWTPGPDWRLAPQWQNRSPTLGSGWSWFRMILDSARRARHAGAMKSNSYKLHFFDLDGSDTVRNN